MKLSAHIMILPRKETFFLEEWINHHLDLGFDKIYVYDNGLITSEDIYGENKPISGEMQKYIDAGYE